MNEHDCNECAYYSALSGLCTKKMDLHHGYDNICDQWRDWEEAEGDDDD